MYYVYMLNSRSDPQQHYIGFTADLRQRLHDHNDGKLPNTARYRPWALATYLAFSSKRQALAFESYLKTGSGYAFSRKRLWPAPLS
jgi:predicted GIY-YIG superfamily endonuclease